jgi:hypothetical protein
MMGLLILDRASGKASLRRIHWNRGMEKGKGQSGRYLGECSRSRNTRCRIPEAGE